MQQHKGFQGKAEVNFRHFNVVLPAVAYCRLQLITLTELGMLGPQPIR